MKKSKLKLGDFVIVLATDYDCDPEHWGMHSGWITKYLRNGWVKGKNSYYKEVSVQNYNLKKATKVEIIKAKLLGKLID